MLRWLGHFLFTLSALASLASSAGAASLWGRGADDDESIAYRRLERRDVYSAWHVYMVYRGRGGVLAVMCTTSEARGTQTAGWVHAVMSGPASSPDPPPRIRTDQGERGFSIGVPRWQIFFRSQPLGYRFDRATEFHIAAPCWAWGGLGAITPGLWVGHEIRRFRRRRRLRRAAHLCSI